MSHYNEVHVQLNEQSICRICLDTEPAKLVSPCLCKGSTEFVHEKCLFTWMDKMIRTKKKQKGIHSFNCQICRFEIKLEYQQIKTCRSCQKIKQKFIKQSQVVYGCCFLFFLLILLSSCIAILAVVSPKVEYVPICILIFFSFLFICLLTKFVYDVTLETKIMFKIPNNNAKHKIKAIKNLIDQQSVISIAKNGSNFSPA